MLTNYVDKAIIYIAKNFHTSIQLDAIAKAIGLSKFHLHRQFKRSTNETIHAYIQRLRIGHAVHLMYMYPRITSVEIAFQSGYSSPSEFARVFNKVYGQSPTVYRKSIPINAKVAEDLLPHLPITFLSKQKTKVQSGFFVKEKIEENIEKIKTLNKQLVGIYLDAPIHVPEEKCRYFLGYVLKSEETSNFNYELEEGYYTYFDFIGQVEEFKKAIISFKQEKIDPSNYEISSFIAFEKIELNEEEETLDYSKLKRRIYLKIQKKQEMHI